MVVIDHLKGHGNQCILNGNCFTQETKPTPLLRLHLGLS